MPRNPKPTDSEDARLIRHHSLHLSQNGHFDKTKGFVQHGHTSVHAHVHQVAAIALDLNRKLRLNANPDHIVRSSLLHDYFLYDWHDKEHEHPRPHGFHHPHVAAENARRDYGLHPHEEDAIRTHMFPLTLRPPKHRVGWLLTTADKVSTFRELKRFFKHKLRQLSRQ